MSKQARNRTREMRAAQAEAARQAAARRRIFMWIGGVVILGLVAAIVWAVVQAVGGEDEPRSTGSGELVVPANVEDEVSVPVGSDDAPVTVSIYFDYMCPACGAFEEANSAELDRMIEDEEALVELRPISFLDRTSQGTEFSTRAANALATVTAESPEHAWAFHQGMFADQPQEGSGGLNDGQIAEIAREAGVPDEVTDMFEDRTYEPWVVQATETAFDSGVEGTPTILIDGETFTGDPYTTGPLSEAVRAAADAEQ